VSAERSDAAVAARLVRARGLVHGVPPAEIAATIVGECGTSRIRAYRLALGIALADVVAQVRARYEADGRPVPRFSETLLSAYESSQKRPGADYLHYLCATYQADPVDLGFAGTCRCGASHRPAASARPAAVPQPPDPDTADGDQDDDELRHMLVKQMTQAGCQLDGQFLGAVDRIRRRMDGVLLGGTVSASLLDTWEQGIAGYGRQYMTVPPLRLLCDVLLDLACVRRMSAARQPLEFADRLCRLACQLAGLAGIFLLDLGDHRLARSYFRTARTAADETGDRQLRAWVAVRDALVPLYYGDPREAAALAGAAAHLAGRQLCGAAVMASVVEARAQARLAALSSAERRAAASAGAALPLPSTPEFPQAGAAAAGAASVPALGSGGLPRGLQGFPRTRTALDPPQRVQSRVRALLDGAADRIGELPDEHRSDTALGYTERQLYFHMGDALVLLGDWQAAQRAFGQAAQLYPQSEVLDLTLVALGRARCLLTAGEPAEALSLAQHTLAGLPPAHRTDLVQHVAKALADAVAQRYRRLPALAEYRQALPRA
jgi:tetratricopeptide (TPR) repeat protein/transcriptional regulator with XRE-family HTH domain